MAINNGEEQQNQLIGDADLAHKTLLQSDALYQVSTIIYSSILVYSVFYIEISYTSV